MKYTERYVCLECGQTWLHEWDTDDYNNDFTQCPLCGSFEFDEVEEVEEVEECTN